MSNTKKAATTSNDTCCICCDTFTKERRAPVSCPKCSTQFCRSCVQRYVLSQETLTGISCMQPDCDCTWTRAFLVQHTTSKFINQDYRSHKKELLFQHELSRMQETMGLCRYHEAAGWGARRSKRASSVEGKNAR